MTGAAVAARAVVLFIDRELTREQFDALLPMVSPQKRERIKKYSSFVDARNSLLGDVLTRRELCRATGLKNEQLELSINEYGKPYLAGNHGIHFNISHSGSYVAVAVDSEPVGIDIEQIKPFKEKIAERFFAPEEIDYISSAPAGASKDNTQNQRFFEVWTKKESRIKWEGKGLSIPLPSFSVFSRDEASPLAYFEVYRSNEAICHVCLTARAQREIQIELHRYSQCGTLI